MAKVNIRESLGRLDLLTDNKYDLRNTYDSSNISNDKKKKLAESLNNNASAKQLYSILNESFDEPGVNVTEEISNTIRDGFLSGLIGNDTEWEVFFESGPTDVLDSDLEDISDDVFDGRLSGKTNRDVGWQIRVHYGDDYYDYNCLNCPDDDYVGNPWEIYDESLTDSDDYEREHIIRLAKAVKEASKGADERKLSNLKKTAKKYLTNHKGTKHEKEYAILQKAYDSLFNESLTEDTVKQNGKWVNKGKEGTHGKFKTKEEADKQRKAMFANGYKAEALKESVEDDYMKQADADARKAKSLYRKNKDVASVLSSLGYSDSGYGSYEKEVEDNVFIVFEYDEDLGRLEYKVVNEETRTGTPSNVLKLNVKKNEDWEPDEWEETDFLDDDGKKVYINIIKEAEDIDDLKDIAHDLYWHDKGLFAMLRHFPKDKSFEWIQQRMIDVIKSTMNESLTEASYGGAYDIEDDMYFTKEEIVGLGYEVCDILKNKFGYDYDIEDIYMNSTASLYMLIIDSHNIEAECTTIIDMRKIRKPSDLYKYSKPIANRMSEYFEEAYQEYEFDESLTEDVSKPDFVVGFYAGPTDEETLEITNPKKLMDVGVSASELKKEYRNVEKLLGDYTSQTADKLKDDKHQSYLKSLILNFAEKKARESGKLDKAFRNEERKFMKSGEIVSMDRKIEEVNYPFEDGIKKLAKSLGIALLPKWGNLKENFAEIQRDFAYARNNWNKLGTGVALDDALEEYNNRYGEEYFYARPLYSESEWNKMVSMFKDKEFWESLNEDVDDEIDLDVETDFSDGSVEEGDTFIEDGRTWSWIERIAGPIHLDFDNWAVWSARDWDYIQDKVRPILINKEEFNVEVLTKIYDEAEVAYFVVDEDTGFIDWGPVETQTEAQDFLNGKVEDWENDDEDEDYDESLKESKDLKEWWTIDFSYTDGEDEYDFEVDGEDIVDYITDKMYGNGEYPDFLEDLSDEEIEAWLDDRNNYPKFKDWVEENFDKLYKKYEDEIFEYFREKLYVDSFEEFDDYDRYDEYRDLMRYNDNGSGMTDRDFL